MTRRSLLSVRLDARLADLLERHCADTGATRTQVVKQSIAQYLVTTSGPTLGSLADEVLPTLRSRPARSKRAAPRQKRYRDYVREKRRR